MAQLTPKGCEALMLFLLLAGLLVSAAVFGAIAVRGILEDL